MIQGALCLACLSFQSTSLILPSRLQILNKFLYQSPFLGATKLFWEHIPGNKKSEDKKAERSYVI